MSPDSIAARASLRRAFLFLFVLGMACAAAVLLQLTAAGRIVSDSGYHGLGWFLLDEFGFLLLSGVGLIACAGAHLICKRPLILALICAAIGLSLLAAELIGRMPCELAHPLAPVTCLFVDPAPGDVSAAAPSDPSDEHGRKFCAVILAMFGMLCFVIAFKLWRRAHQSVHWPTAQGQMTASRIIIHPPFPRKRPNWRLDIEYAYAVDGRQFSGRTPFFGAEPSKAASRKIVARFPAGSQVRVHYHPFRHELSVLVPGPNWYTYGGFLIAPIAWLFAAVIWPGALIV